MLPLVQQDSEPALQFFQPCLMARSLPGVPNLDFISQPLHNPRGIVLRYQRRKWRRQQGPTCASFCTASRTHQTALSGCQHAQSARPNTFTRSSGSEEAAWDRHFFHCKFTQANPASLDKKAVTHATCCLLCILCRPWPAECSWPPAVARALVPVSTQPRQPPPQACLPILATSALS